MGPTNNSEDNTTNQTQVSGSATPKLDNSAQPVADNSASSNDSALVPGLDTDPMSQDTSGIDIIPNANSPENSSDKPASPESVVTGSDTTSMPDSSDMPSPSPLAPGLDTDPMSQDTSGIDIIPNANSPENSSDKPASPESVVTGSDTTSMPDSSDMPSPSPAMPAAPVAPETITNSTEPQMTSDTPNAQIPSNPVSPMVLQPKPVKKKNNIVIIITAIILVAMLVVLYIAYTKTKS